MTDTAASYQARRGLELLLDGARWTVATFGHWFVIWMLVWVLGDAVGMPTAIGWAVALSVVLLAQALFATRWTQARLDTLDAEGVARCLKTFTVSAWLVGACWAVAGVVLFAESVPELQLFLVFVMGGMSLAAVGTQHVHLPACYGSMGFAVPVLACRYALEGQWIEPVLLVLYTLVILRLARMLSRFSLRTIRLQHERDQLLHQLTARAQDLEAARREAEEANLSKSRFLAQASHDLRQPLHAIGLFVEALSSPAGELSEGRTVHRIRESVAMLSNLFDSLLDVTVLDAGTTRPNVAGFKLNEMFDQLRKDFAPIAAENGVSLRIVNTRACVLTDVVLFRRLLQNLLSNAIRYAPQGRVLVGARRSGDGWAVEVLDNGPGIAAEDRERIFQEFVKLDTGRPRGSAGLGLGLSIVSRLSRLLGLEVVLDSEPGRGTRFRVDGLETANAIVPLTEPAGREDPLDDTRVLVVDDDREVLDATAALLRSWGCEVTASVAFPAAPPEVDVALSDYELDGADGLALLCALRNEQPDVLPVLISGNSSAELRSAAADADVPLLHKPVRPVRLRSLLLQLATREA